jgi:RNA polymerase sigma-70 factor (ECF subfamily)
VSNINVFTQTAELLDDDTVLEPTDEQIVAIVRAGSSALFETIYRRYYPRAFRLAFGVTGNREQADDLTQEIFLRVYRGLPSYNEQASFGTWFYRVALNHCWNHIRRERWRRFWVDSTEIDVQRSSSARGEEQVLQREIQGLVRDALQTLKPQARILLILKDLEGFSYQEIAERLECSQGSVASGVSRARKLLARKLSVLKGKI